MKLKHIGMIVVSVLAMSSAAVSAAEGDESVTTTVNGGVIHFKGEVVNAACAIDSESMNQTVELGQVRSSRLFPLWRQCYFYCSLLAIAPLPTQLSHWVRLG